MITRLEFCKTEIQKCHNEHNKFNKMVQELNNLLPTYKEKIAFQEFIREIKKMNA